MADRKKRRTLSRGRPPTYSDTMERRLVMRCSQRDWNRWMREARKAGYGSLSEWGREKLSS